MQFSCVQETFLRVIYVQSCTHIGRRNRIVWEIQCQSRFQWWRRHKKIVNAFGISRTSVLAIIKRVSYAITTFSGPGPIKLPTTENKMKELTNKLLGTYEFPQCIGTIDDTEVRIVELNERYTDYINGKCYFSLNAQPVCN